MEIIFHHPFFKFEEWKAKIKEHLPQANVVLWEPGKQYKADYALVWHPPEELFPSIKGLKAVFALGAGVDAILEQERNHPGWLPSAKPLIRLEDTGMAKQMSEYCLAAVYRYFRRLDEYQLQQKNKVWHYLLPIYTYDNFIIGVLGLGVLGSQVAQFLAHAGFTVRGWSRSQKQLEKVTCYKQDELLEFTAGTKLFINLLPSTPETHEILNSDFFNQLKDAYLINIARGKHVNEQDLLRALEKNQIAAATLDVFNQEPLPSDSPLWEHPRIMITPHIAAMTEIQESIKQICYKITQLEQGKPVTGIVNIERGY